MKISHSVCCLPTAKDYNWYNITDYVLGVTELLPKKPAKFWSRFPFDVYCETEDAANTLADFFRAVYQNDNAVTVEYCDEEDLNPGDITAGWWCVTINTKGKNVNVTYENPYQEENKWW